MPRPSFSPAQVEATRQHICEAALRVFERDGIDAATMRTIGREAGCSPAAPYLYFESKDAILARLRADGFDGLAAALERSVAFEGTAFERLAALVRAYVGFALERPEVYRLMFEIHLGDRDTDARVRAAREWAFGVARKIYAESVDGDPTDWTHLLWLELHGLVSLHLANQLDRGRTLPELVEIMIATGLNAGERRTPGKSVRRRR